MTLSNHDRVHDVLTEDCDLTNDEMYKVIGLRWSEYKPMLIDSKMKHVSTGYLPPFLCEIKKNPVF